MMFYSADDHGSKEKYAVEFHNIYALVYSDLGSLNYYVQVNIRCIATCIRMFSYILNAIVGI